MEFAALHLDAIELQLPLHTSIVKASRPVSFDGIRHAVNGSGLKRRT